MSRLIAVLLLSAACAQPAAPPPPASVATTSETTRATETREPVEVAPPESHQPNPATVVEEFGRRMQRVSLLAPDAAKQIRETYAGLVEPALLKEWANDPGNAPGRQTSSPYPDRIEVSDVATNAEGAVITGDIVEMTSTGEAGRTPVRVTVVRKGEDWIIHRYDAGESSDSAVAALREYYAAINARDYRRAFAMWGSSGPPKQTYEQFAGGFADTKSVRVETGEPSRVEAAAGSRYVEVPVVIITNAQRFEGTYVMRRSVVDGASDADRHWHIYRATVRAAKS